MAQGEDPITRLASGLDELRRFVERLRFHPSASSLAGRAVRGAQHPLDTLDAKLVGLRAALYRVETQVSALQAQLERAERETWTQKAKRADATARGVRTERLLKEIHSSVLWKGIKPLWKLLHRRAADPITAPPADDLMFGIDAPTRWEIGSEIVLVRGWCVSRSGRDIAGVRGKIGRKGRIGQYGYRRDDVSGAIGDWYGSARSGFTIEMPVPLGVSQLRLEAIVQGGEWELFYEQEVKRTEDGGYASPEPVYTNAPALVKREILPRHPGINARKAADLIELRLQERTPATRAATPQFSIITPTYNSKPQWLAEAALSVINQTIDEWEWCLVDDGSTDRETRQLLDRMAAMSPRLRVSFSKNGGISAATNQALDLATGEFVCFLDHDDLLTPTALEQMQRKAAEDFEVIYSDEDKLDDRTGALVEPFFKPDWSPEYFRGAMYVGHLLCVRRELAQQVRFNSEFDGIQDFEFMLRVSETGAKIGHVDEVLYHWRKTAGSIAESGDAKGGIDVLQGRAVNAHLARIGLPARAETKLPHRLRIVPSTRSAEPLVSVIIPSRDAPEHLGRCLSSLFSVTSYPRFEVIVMDNDTSDPDAIQIMADHPIRRIAFPGKFNFSRANNRGVSEAQGEFVVFLNNDTEIISADWLHHLLYYAEQPDIGAAGALLVYDDRTVQHGGVALGMRGTADHLMRGFPLNGDGYAGSLACAREVSAVTAACMMMRKALFNEVGGFNEHFFTAYQDLDLCLRLRARGLRIIHTPEAVVVHHEWTSRKTYYDMVDRTLLLDQWEALIDAGDPFYNRNLNLERGDYSPAGAA